MAALALIAGWQQAAWGAAAPDSLADLTLEDLANVVITSVSRRPQTLASAPASVFVITADDLRRSGALTLPDALRLAPTLQIAQLNAREWAISTRGFTSLASNKLLVLIDGRTVYSPLFSGVFWDAQDLVLDDVERIEVVSGPAGSTWGTNAVNGIINVITKSSSETQGLLAKAAGGDREHEFSARYGGTITPGAHFRAYAKSYGNDGTRQVDSTPATDAWHRSQGGFRADWSTAKGLVTVQGDAYQGAGEDRPTFGQVTFDGANVLARWSRTVDEHWDLDVQAYYDRTARTDRFILQEKAHLLDTEAKLRWSGGAHRVLVGGGYRSGSDASDPGVLFAFVPPSKDLSWANVFAQDEIQVTEAVQVTAGYRVERNPYTGWESLPNVRVGWSLSPETLLWASASRAVRSPARFDRDLVLPPEPPYVIAGGPSFVSEIGRTIELGMRSRLASVLTGSVAVYQTDFRRLKSAQISSGQIFFANMIEGQVRGMEASAQWQATREWRLTAGYTWLGKDLHLVPGSNDPTGPANLGDDPHTQWSVRSTYRPRDRFDVEVALRHVGALPQPAVPAYTAVDLRAAWQLTPSIEATLALRNAFDPWHLEMQQRPFTSEIPRSVLVQLRWQLH
jgi:iron complex outermembrane receptor protein